MKCASCPLFTSWNNENDRGEACGLFGDGWDSPFQYEDKDGAIVGCYIDKHFIVKTDEEYQEHLLREADSWAAWMIEEESRPNILYKDGVIMKTCQDFLSYRCVGCKHFSRDLPENCVVVCEFNTGECIDCVSFTDCAQRLNFARRENARNYEKT